MTLNLDDLEAVARAATPGPWEAEPYLYTADDDRVRVTSPSDGPLFNLAEGVEPVNASHIAAFDPPTVLALITRIREAERHNVQLLREAVKREGRVRRAEGAIAEALNHDPLHGRKEGIHCGGMAPCIRDALTTYKPTNQDGGDDGT